MVGSKMRWVQVLIVLFALVGLVGGRLSAGDTNSVLSAWLSSQTNLQTWSATVIQTRALKSLTRPLTATGHGRRPNALPQRRERRAVQRRRCGDGSRFRQTGV